MQLLRSLSQRLVFDPLRLDDVSPDNDHSLGRPMWTLIFTHVAPPGDVSGVGRDRKEGECWTQRPLRSPCLLDVQMDKCLSPSFMLPFLFHCGPK